MKKEILLLFGLITLSFGIYSFFQVPEIKNTSVVIDESLKNGYDENISMEESLTFDVVRITHRSTGRASHAINAVFARVGAVTGQVSYLPAWVTGLAIHSLSSVIVIALMIIAVIAVVDVVVVVAMAVAVTAAVAVPSGSRERGVRVHHRYNKACRHH